MSDEEFKKTILEKIRSLNRFIREMEDQAKFCGLKIEDDRLYVAMCAQRKILRDLLGGR